MFSKRKSPLKSITLKDVAALAGVSPKTVSNVINDWPYVTDETRQRVRAAIDTLGYRPSQLARSLVTGNTKTIGLVLPDISNPFFSHAVRGCEDVLSNANYNLFLSNTDEDPQKESNYLNMLFSRAVDGVIVWGSRSQFTELISHVGEEMPLVIVDCPNPIEGSKVTCVNVDSLGGARIATEHLVRAGYRSIAHVAGPTQRPTAQLRLQGYKEGLHKTGISFKPELVIEGMPTIRGGYFTTCQLLSNVRPQAIFAYNDLMAIGAIVAAQQLNLSVPRDIAVVGFDDIILASLIEPTLTTIRIPQYELGKLVGELLLERIMNHNLPQKMINFPVALQIRRSCGSRRFTKKQKQLLLQNLVSSVSADLPG